MYNLIVVSCVLCTLTNNVCSMYFDEQRVFDSVSYFHDASKQERAGGVL